MELTMAVDIEALEGPTQKCFAYLRYLFPRYRSLNEELLNLTYNTFGVAKDLPAILGLKPFSEPDGIIKIDWDEALDNVLSILQHRDMVEEHELLREISIIADFVIGAYRCNLCTPHPYPIVIKWSA
jgi:hypothetical protein